MSVISKGVETHRKKTGKVLFGGGAIAIAKAVYILIDDLNYFN